MTTSHLFAYMHGQEAMDAIFGKTETPELFSPKINGLLIEESFDSGKIASYRPSTLNMDVKGAPRI
jgi:hypothetical protein